MILRTLLISVIVLSFSRCLIGDTKCCDHVSTYSISNKLYVEQYRTFCAGVFGELTYCYITDSSSFRQKIGFYDEHESFRVNLNGDKIETYNLQSYLISDTVERKTITKTDLWKYHHNDTTCINTSPVFGKNTLECSNDFFPVSSYKDGDGYYIAQIQYKCNTNHSNAVFYTDSLNFCIFVGIYIPGSFENNYHVKWNRNEDQYDFYNITQKFKSDTVKTKTFLLADVRKGKLIKVCK